MCAFPNERSTLTPGESQRALPRLVVNHQEVVNLSQCSRNAAFLLCLAALRAAHEHTPPAVGCGIAEGAKKSLY